MAQKNRANMLTDIVSNIYNNLVNFITGQNAQDRFVNLLDSSPNILSDKDQADGYVGLGPTSQMFSSYYNENISRSDLITLLAANLAVGFKFYQVNDAVGSTRILLVMADSNITLYPIGTDLATGEQGTYDITTDVFTVISGNASITPITAAALLALPSFSTTTIYVVTDANSNTFKMAIQAETTSQLGQTGTIIDDVYSGIVNYDLGTNTFLNGTIYDGDGNIWNGCLPSDNINLGAGSEGNTFHQGVRNITLGTNSNGNIFEYSSGLGADITCGTDAINNIFKQGTEGFTFGNNLQNTTIEANILGANYTASPTYDFLYNNLYDSVIFQSGGVNYHRYFDVANNRIVVTNLATPANITYLDGNTWGSVLVNASLTAVLSTQYVVVASATFTDPITPAEGKGFQVYVRNGTATIGGVGYSVVGSVIWRVFHSGSWATYVINEVTPSSTNTLTNKRITARTGTVASSATPTINTDNVDFFSITAQNVDITSFTTNLSGTPTIDQTLWIAITGTAARAITWGASFEASTIALPTTTVTTARLDVAFIWNSVTSKWRCVGVA